MSSCPLCDGRSVETFLRRPSVPVFQNLVLSDRSSALTAPRGDLDMTVCADCGFVFNRSFEPAKIAYGKGYENNQAHSAYFETYLDSLAADVLAQTPENSTIVEVGCGNGHFLRKLVTSSNRGIGFDPSYDGSDSTLGGRLTFQRRYYDEKAAAVRADAVVCRHVIEHVPRPLQLLRNVRAAAANARLFLETPCVEWILTNTVIWDFFYEHCSLFSAASLSYACATAGLAADDVTHTFGEQYLWLKGKSTNPSSPAPPGGANMVKIARAYAAECARLCEQWSERLFALHRNGPVALWGAGAKGVTFANLVDPHHTLLTCVVDINPKKQGRYIPGTGHEIISPTELSRNNVKSAVILNPNYRSEIASFLEAFGAKIDLIDWL